MLCMNMLQTSTLILTTCVTAVRQWIAELIDKTDIDPSCVGEYTGQRKEVRKVTVATYQMLTHRGRGRAAAADRRVRRATRTSRFSTSGTGA